jgi:hypothetical protein
MAKIISFVKSAILNDFADRKIRIAEVEDINTKKQRIKRNFRVFSDFILYN